MGEPARKESAVRKPQGEQVGFVSAAAARQMITGGSSIVRVERFDRMCETLGVKSRKVERKGRIARYYSRRDVDRLKKLYKEEELGAAPSDGKSIEPKETASDSPGMGGFFERIADALERQEPEEPDLQKGKSQTSRSKSPASLPVRKARVEQKYGKIQKNEPNKVKQELTASEPKAVGNQPKRGQRDEVGARLLEQLKIFIKEEGVPSESGTGGIKDLQERLTIVERTIRDFEGKLSRLALKFL